MRILLFLLILCSLLCLPGELCIPGRTWSGLDLIKHHAEQNRLDWRLVMSIIIVESEGNPEAFSRYGDRGLMQLQPIHAIEAGVKPANLFDIDINLRLGCLYLRSMINLFGLHGGIQAYNLGPTKYLRGKRSKKYLLTVKNCLTNIMKCDML